MKKDEFTKQVTSKLDQLAREQHHNKMLVMNHVLDSVQKRPTSFYSIWKMTGSRKQRRSGRCLPMQE